MNAWRLRRAATGGSDSSRYCYTVWLRHLTILADSGFRSINDARVGELGPGDSIGTGLAALLSGAKSYVALDIVPFNAKADLPAMIEDLVRMFSAREGIPDHREFPAVRPRLACYAFPHQLIDNSSLNARAARIRRAVGTRLSSSDLITYKAPWISPEVIQRSSLDLIFSQAALEHVDALQETYRAMSDWLRPGGYASHVIDFGAHQLSSFWNGHWAYGDIEWRLVRGRREFLLNREPLTTHLDLARKSGLEIVAVSRDYDDNGLPNRFLAPRFQKLDAEDSRTRGAVLLLRKGN
jgi:SAM-dependent methyltransferase